ncbi:MAG: hypothetical protein ACFFCS_25510 [Candidatus Hodarchaeota archaeon]
MVTCRICGTSLKVEGKPKKYNYCVNCFKGVRIIPLYFVLLSFFVLFAFWALSLSLYLPSIIWIGLAGAVAFWIIAFVILYDSYFRLGHYNCEIETLENITENRANTYKNYNYSNCVRCKRIIVTEKYDKSKGDVMVTPSFEGYCPNCFKKVSRSKTKKILGLYIALPTIAFVFFIVAAIFVPYGSGLFVTVFFSYFGFLFTSLIPEAILSRQEKEKLKNLQDIFMGQVDGEIAG